MDEPKFCYNCCFWVPEFFDNGGCLNKDSEFFEQERESDDTCKEWIGDE